MKWLKGSWAFLSLGVVVVAAMVLFASYWEDTNRLAALGSLFGFIVAALLVGITIEYVRTNQSTLKLLRAQWKAQNEIEVKFGLREREGKAQVWVLNYGLANVVLTKITIEFAAGDRQRTTLFKNMIVASGRKKFFNLPNRLWENIELQQNLQVTAYCESTTQRFEQAKVYTLSTEHSKVYKIKRGLRGVWTVGCPRCQKFLGICMVTDGLKSFEEARERQKQMEDEVSKSCPQHASDWMLTMEHVRTPEKDDIEI